MQPQNPHTPQYGAPPPSDPPPYAAPPPSDPPPYAAPPPSDAPPYAAATPGGPPPYAAPAPYLMENDAARAARQRKGNRDIGFGIVWLTLGVVVTGVTLASDSSIVLVAWGPALYGLYLVIRGAMAVSRSRR